ncbi:MULTISPECIES: ROK family protein [unclassified Streptomyces]|uniref:ROK family protein n=1 Tax=unclassified Streptomyces TaxID=2593676 RepID=UPI0022545AE4|nr:MULTISPECIES: ROK family protein [unclassified Streptomyces]MCX4648094.1 ROK family protein [Streptomyces sp. NBC_01446]MCX5323784.1 ROK family protein [Streptomyces sp. NBC_00120]
MTARPANVDQARLLRLLRDLGPQSRVALGGQVELSRSKLAVEIERLLETGLVVQDGLAASRGGRRSHNVRIAPSLRFLGVDIGATSVDAAVTNAELEVLGHLSEPLDVREGPVAVFERVLALAAKLCEEGLAEHFDGAGIGVPGPVRFPEGVPVAPPIMPGWDGFPIREVLSQELGCPVLVDNDVNLMALGEQQAGVARSVRDFLCVKVGTGIGCGIVVAGDVHRGVTGSAGDIGHIQVDLDGSPCACGNTGCLEAHFGGNALVRDATALAEAGRSAELAGRLEAMGRLTPEDVSAAAGAGDAASLELIRLGGTRTGQVIAGLVSFFNPGMVVIGGGLTGLGHTLLASIRTQVYRQSLPLATGNLPIVLGELGQVAGVVGATRLISDHIFSPS